MQAASASRAVRCPSVASGGARRSARRRRRHTDSLRAFDRAAEVLPPDCTPDANGPYVALDEGHLARWRGHALARIGDPSAVPVLVGALRVHNTEYTRAEAALRVDLVVAHLAAGDVDSATAQHRMMRPRSPTPSAPSDNANGSPCSRSSWADFDMLDRA